MFPRQLQRTVSRALSPNAMKIHQWPPMLFGFLIKKHEVPPTHTLKEYVADTTYIDVDSVLLKIKRDSNQVQNMKQSLCQNRKHITATERHSLQMCLFVKQLFAICRQITNHRLIR
jgi:hypothetical protein